MDDYTRPWIHNPFNGYKIKIQTRAGAETHIQSPTGESYGFAERKPTPHAHSHF